MNKQTTILLLASLASIALGVGATLGVSYGFGIDYGTTSETPTETDETDGLETDVTETQNMAIKRLSVETLASGETVQTFSYTITPANATNQNINTSVEYQDGGAATEVTASIDTAEKTITLTCNAAFDKVILVKLTAADGGGASATITCNYEKKIIGHEGQTFTFIFDDANEGYDIFDYLINETNFFEYSKYTIDHDYTNGYMDQTESAHDLTFKGVDSYTFSSNLSQKLTAIFNGEHQIATSEELWELATSEDRANLKSSNGYIYLSNAVEWGFTMHDGDFSYTVIFDSEPQFSIKLNIEDFNLNISEIDVSGADNVIF